MEAFLRFVQNVEERFVRVVVTKNAVKNTEPMIQNIVNGTVVIEVFDFDRLNTHPTNGCCIGTLRIPVNTEGPPRDFVIEF